MAKAKQPAGLPMPPREQHPHKFILGQAVAYTPPGGTYAPPGIHVVTAKLPERDGEFEYHIKHSSELHETHCQGKRAS
jgi:hypothetical protein